MDAAGQWLSDPVAELLGTADGSSVRALVKLSSPRLSMDKTVLTFQVRSLQHAHLCLCALRDRVNGAATIACSRRAQADELQGHQHRSIQAGIVPGALALQEDARA